MLKVFLTDNMFFDYDTPRKALEKLGAELVIASKSHDTETFIREGSDADVVICIKGPLEDAFIESLAKARMVIRTGVGVDAANVPACNKRGIPVCNVPDFCRDEVADHTMALKLSMLRGLPNLRQGR
jgi:D-3-phosphoglycerate dehydrogenase